MMRLHSVPIGLALAGLTFAPAYAETAGGVDITGTWTFETVWYASGYTERQLTGDMTIEPALPNGAHPCRFTTKESEKADPEWFAESVQTCVVRYVNNALMIRSQVETATPNYVEDNFTLRIVDPNTMKGVFTSWDAPEGVTFIRQEQAIS